MNGKDKRLRAILNNKKAIIVPMDHGMSDGPIKGLINVDKTIEEVTLGGASSVILHKGIIKSLNSVPDTGLIMHASAGTCLQQDTNNKRLVGSVTEAIRLGADAMSLHINVGGSNHEPDMLAKLGNVAEECDLWDIPLLAMMYPRGKSISSPIDPKQVEIVTRVGAELGADIVKSVYTGDVDSFSRVVEGCPVPIVVAGGPKLNNNRQVLQMVADITEAGAIGVMLGRNIFQHESPQTMTRAIQRIITKSWSVDKALEELESTTAPTLTLEMANINS
ncbi:MAG: 2-amino-3,7-dideoxy-D-threo-hept-6-ulosonate synthase [Candidatus Zixiibacteriota bacterium]